MRFAALALVVGVLVGCGKTTDPPEAYAAHLHAARLHLEDLNRFGWAP